MSEEIALAAADLTECARLRAERDAAVQARDQALRAEAAERAKRQQVESQLGTALAEVARLEAALRKAAHMKTIKGARRIVEDTLGV